jgi:hypothetical protein
MIRILIIIHSLFLLSVNVLFSQVTQEWAKTYFNETQNVYGKVIAVDTLGNVYSAGDGGNFYTAVVKYNSAGSQVWAYRYMLDDSYPSYIIVDKNGDVYLAGTSYYYVLTKISKDGNLLWKRTYDGTQYQTQNFLCGLVLTESNCPIISGAIGFAGTNADIVTIKYNTNGDTLWTARYNSLNNNVDQARSLAQAKDGSLLIAGYRYNGTALKPSFLSVKYDSSGVFKWARTYGSPDSSNWLYDGTFDNNGNSFVVGWLNEYAYCTIKYNANGDFKWARTYSSTVSSFPYAIKTDNNGNVIVTGNDYSSTQGFLSTIKYDSLGNQLWINNLSQISPNFTNLNNRNSMKIDNSNNIYLTGSYNINSSGSQLGMFTSKINSNGILNWYKVFYGNMKQDGGAGIVIDKYNNVYSVGTTEDSLNGWGFVTIKYSQPTSISQISKDVPERYKLFQNYPNPFNSSTRIKYEIQKNSMVQLKVYDMLGKEIQTLVSEEQNAGTYETSFNGQNLSSGIYIYEIQVINKDGNSNTYREVKRMVLLK